MGMHHLAAILDPSKAVQHRLLNPPSGYFLPSNVSPPIVYGVKATGQVLACIIGSWNGTNPITYTFQWLKNGTPISGATNSSYTVLAQDSSENLSCTVTGHNIEGTASATSQVI